MKYLKDFYGQKQGIGYMADTPFVSILNDVEDKALFISEDYGEQVEVIDDGSGFITFDKPVMTITTTNSTDTAVLSLTVEKNDLVKGDVVWSCNLSSSIAKIEGSTLTFISHYEGNMRLTAKADNCVAYKTIMIACDEEITATTYALGEISPIGTVAATATTATINYTDIPTYHYKMKPDEEGDAIEMSSAVTFEANTSTTEVTRTGSFTDDYGVTVDWSITQEAGETPLVITTTDSTDTKPLALTATRTAAVLGTLVWSSDLSSDVAKIEDDTLTFLTHYEGPVHLAVTADNCSATKTINITCDEEITATTWFLDTVSSIADVAATATSATVKYSEYPVYYYEFKTITGDSVDKNKEVTFEANTSTTEVTRTGSFTDENNVTVNWSVKQSGAEVLNQIINVYNVTDTASAIKLYHSAFTSSNCVMYVDDVQTTLSTGYTFSTTGEHTVRFVCEDGITTCYGMFSACTALYSSDWSNFETSASTKMNHVFHGCSGLTSVNLTNVNTSASDDLSYMFMGCSGLTSIDVSGFDLSNVYTIQNMFNGCTHLASIDVSSWDTSNMENLQGTFSQCWSLTTLDLSAWDVSNVTSMASLFDTASGLTSIDVSTWDTSKVQGMWGIFLNCNALISVDVSGWITTAVTSIASAFRNCYSLTAIDVSGWRLSKVTNFERMFEECHKLKTIDVSNWGVSSATTNISRMFQNCIWLESIDVSKWDVSKVYYFNAAFSNCGSLKELNVNTWDVSAGGNFYATFGTCSGLTSLDLSNWKTTKATDMHNMFDSCHSLTSITLTNFDTSNVTTIASMFYKCYNLKSIDISMFNTIKVTNMNTMFAQCGSLTNLDLSNFVTTAVTDMHWMFYQCAGLTSLDLTSFETPALTNMQGMFAYCSKLTSINLSTFNTDTITNMSGTFQNCGNASSTLNVTYDSSIGPKFTTLPTSNPSYITFTDVAS